MIRAPPAARRPSSTSPSSALQRLGPVDQRFESSACVLSLQSPRGPCGTKPKPVRAEFQTRFPPPASERHSLPALSRYSVLSTLSPQRRCVTWISWPSCSYLARTWCYAPACAAVGGLGRRSTTSKFSSRSVWIASAKPHQSRRFSDSSSFAYLVCGLLDADRLGKKLKIPLQDGEQIIDGFP